MKKLMFLAAVAMMTVGAAGCRCGILGGGPVGGCFRSAPCSVGSPCVTTGGCNTCGTTEIAPGDPIITSDPIYTTPGPVQ